MPTSRDLDAIGRCLSNRLDKTQLERRFAGVIGDAPSHYSKSPRLWNAAFARLQMDAVYVPLDVEEARLGDLLKALIDCDGFLGANVTVPHKTRVMDFLDAVDPGAQRIRAVNTIVRSSSGALVGYNTDGAGFIESLHTRINGGDEVFLPSLRGASAVVLGAGGSARAVALHLADALAGGRLLICNRTLRHAAALADEIARAGRNAMAIGEEHLPLHAPHAELIVNCTTKGQGGMRRLSGGRATLMEPYSALAPAHPPSFPAQDFTDNAFESRWLDSAGSDIETNQRVSLELAAAIPARTRFYDLIYHPEETVFLRHARATGHRTRNGKLMIIHQAAIAFCERICEPDLRARGLDTPGTRASILQTMYHAW